MDKELWVDNNCRRASIIRNFGVPSLLQRLAAAKNEVQRARVWWREAAACSEGETIPDLAADNMAVLNPFIVTKELKFRDIRFERLKKADFPVTEEEQRIQNTRKRIRQARAGRLTARMAKKLAAATRF